jgi:hypothetical protein
MGRCYYRDHRYGGGSNLDNRYSEGVLVMFVELDLNKKGSYWVLRIYRWPETLRKQKFKTKSEAREVLHQWKQELKAQHRRFIVDISRGSGRREDAYGIDFDGSYVRQPRRQWRDPEIQLRFFNKYGDQTLFLRADDWTFVDKLIVDMRLQKDWWCEITQHGESRTVFKPEKMAGENDRQSAA